MHSESRFHAVDRTLCALPVPAQQFRWSGPLRQFLKQLHVLDQEIADNVADVPTLLLRDAFQTLLQLAVEVDRQTYARSLPVKLASLRFGNVVMWLHRSSPRYCAVSLRSARRTEIKRIFALVSRPPSFSSRKVRHTASD